MSIDPRRRLAACLIGVTSLIGCAALNNPKPSHDFAVLLIELEPQDFEPGPPPAHTLERPWVSTRLWSFRDPPARNPNPQPTTGRILHFRLRTRDGQRQTPTLLTHLTDDQVGRPRSRSGPLGDVAVLTLDQPGVSLALTGGRLERANSSQAAYTGLGRISFHHDFLRAASRAYGQVSPASLLQAALLGLDASELLAFAALPQPPTLEQVIQLAHAGVTASDAQQLASAGYAFGVDQLIELRRQGVPAADAVAFRQSGFVLGAQELIQLHQAGVTPDYAAAMQQAGVISNLADLIDLRRAGVEPGYASRMRALDAAGTAQDLIRLHQRSISVETVSTFRDAGYRLQADQLMLLDRAGVQARDALALRRAGYSFTLGDLMELARWHVPVRFTLSLMDERYEPLAADQIVNLYLRRITPQMVQALRRPRQTPAVEAASR